MSYPTTRIVRVAACQFSRSLGDKNLNIRRVGEFVAAGGEIGATVVSVPELFSTGYFPTGMINPDYFEWAEPIPGPTTDALCKMASNTGCTIVGSIFEHDIRNHSYFNTAVVVGPGGLLGVYRKRHVPFLPDMAEKYYFFPGDLPYLVVDLAEFSFGVAICYDRHFPEIFRLLALAGADVVFTLNNTPSRRSRSLWEVEMRSNASSNGIFIVQNNACEDIGELSFFGGTAVASPHGDIVDRLDGRHDALLTVDLDLSVVEEARRHYASIRDARLEDLGSLDQGILKVSEGALGHDKE